MHERAAVAQAVADAIDTAGGERIAHVVLEIGPGVSADFVEACWRELAVGTTAADTTLSFCPALDELVCLRCSDTYNGTTLDPCPRCGGDGLVVAPAPEVALGELQAADGSPRVGARRQRTPRTRPSRPRQLHDDRPGRPGL